MEHKIFDHQLALEISLRSRVLEVTRARIRWAEILQQSLCSIPIASYPIDFETAAFRKVQEISSRCRFLYAQRGTNPIQPTAVAENVRRESKNGPLFIQQGQQILALVCPSCQRSNFPTLQGLLNHCRLAHSLTYATHDDCVCACARLLDSPREARRILMEGVEIIGNVRLPSLRRIFEQAVGLTSSLTEAVDGTALSKDLGLHSDSPALAPFLGKPAKRDAIQVWPNDEELDVINEETTEKVRWRPPFHGSRSPVFLDGLEIDRPVGMDPLAAGPGQGATGGTRFHMKRRIVITGVTRCIQQCIAQDPILSQRHLTHQWTLAVTSPSYTQHIDTFLRGMVVTSATHPPLFEEVTIHEPPFSVSGLTDRSFLARLVFEWAGGPSQNAPRVVEHWVELDSAKAGNFRGEQQMLDIELDRSTPLLPLVDGNKPAYIETLAAAEKAGPVGPLSENPGHVLEDSMKPLILAVRGRVVPDWTAPEVYHSADVHQNSSPFIDTPENISRSPLADQYCSRCGVPSPNHPPQNKPNEHDCRCSLNIGERGISPAADLSLWGIRRGSTAENFTEQNTGPQILRPPLRVVRLVERDLVAACDPRMATSIWSIVSHLGLVSFIALHRTASQKEIVDGQNRMDMSEFPLAILGVVPARVDRTMAPYALLAIATQSFIRHLMRIIVAIPLPQGHSRSATQPRMLTPAHVAQALVHSRYLGGESSVLAACMARPAVCSPSRDVIIKTYVTGSL